MTPNLDPENDGTTPDGTQSSVTSQPSSQQLTSGGEDWEARYKGLQKVTAKKEATIAELTGKLDQANATLESLRLSQTSTDAQRVTAEQAKAGLESQLTALQADHAKLQKTLLHQGIVLQEFPQLSTLFTYIPEASSVEDLRVKAKKFADDLASTVQSSVKQVMSGGSPPQPTGTGQLASEAEGDKLWDEVCSLAGRPGKEKEYAVARERWETFMKSKK
jgi:hypothetical protein